MGSLLVCMKRAGDRLNREDRRAIINRAVELRKAGLSPVAAAVRAIDERSAWINDQLADIDGTAESRGAQEPSERPNEEPNVGDWTRDVLDEGEELSNEELADLHKRSVRLAREYQKVAKTAADQWGLIAEEAFPQLPLFKDGEPSNEFGHGFIWTPNDGEMRYVVTDMGTFEDGATAYRSLPPSNRHGAGVPLTYMKARSLEFARAYQRRVGASYFLEAEGFDLAEQVPKKAVTKLKSTWTKIAKLPGVFRYTTWASKRKGLQDVATELLDDTGITMMVGEDMGPDEGFSILIEQDGQMPQSAGIEILKTPGYVIVHASGLNKGSGFGTPLYQVAAEFARRNGYTVIPDEGGLLGVNTYRRTEQQFSAAVRAGSAAYMRAGWGQRVYGWERRPDAEGLTRNFARLALAGLRNVSEVIPEFRDTSIAYNIETGEFTRDGKPAGKLIAEILRRPEVKDMSAGESTLARAAITSQIVAGEDVLAGVTSSARPIMYSHGSDERGDVVWRSKFADTVAAANTPQRPASDWASWIKTLPQKGVKPEEIEWTGVLDWLGWYSWSAKTPADALVTKEDLVAWLDGRLPWIEEVELRPREEVEAMELPEGFTIKPGEMRPATTSEMALQVDAEYSHRLDEIRAAYETLPPLEQERIEELDSAVWEVYRSPASRDRDPRDEAVAKAKAFFDWADSVIGHFKLEDIADTEVPKSWTVYDAKGKRVAGGKTRTSAETNAKEKLYPVAQYYGDNFRAYRDTTLRKYREVLLRMDRPVGGDEHGPTYSGGHWAGYPNVVVHYRLGDDVWPLGRKELPARLVELMEKRESHRKANKGRDYDQWVAGGLTSDEEQEMQDLLVEAQRRDRRVLVIQEVQSDLHQRGKNRGYTRDPSARGSAIPDLPWKASWHALALKSILRKAANEGYDRVEWTTGTEQVIRNESSARAVVRKVSWEEAVRPLPQLKPEDIAGLDEQDTQEYLQDVWGASAQGPQIRLVTVTGMRGSQIDLHVAENGELWLYRHSQDQGGGQPLSAVVGKDLADKIMSTKKGSASGDGLIIGGKLHRLLYDVKIPQELEALTKGLGAVIDTRPGEPRKGINITPAMREAASKGFNLFSRGAEERWKPKPEVAAALGRHLKSLTPEEWGKLNRATAARLAKIIDELPSAGEMAAIAYAGRAKRGWYEKATNTLMDVFGLDAPRFVALLAAMSPQTSVELDLRNALRVWTTWVNEGRPTTRRAIRAVMGRSGLGHRGGASVLPAWVPNAVRALQADDPVNVVLSGPKVHSFMRNLLGYVDEVTNDAWMATYALVNQRIFAGKLNRAGTDPGKSPGYLAMTARVREAARTISKLTGEYWSPAEVQETIWSWAKTLYETASTTRSAAEIVNDRALTDELIRSTPDFATLLHYGENADLLREAGLRVPDLPGDAAAGEGQEPRTGGEAAPFTERTQRGFERRAAARLDTAREAGIGETLRSVGAEGRAAQAPETSSGPLDWLVRKAGGEVVRDYFTQPVLNRLLAAGVKVTPDWIRHGLESDFGLSEQYLDARADRHIGFNKRVREAKKVIDGLAELDRNASRVAYQWMQEKPDTELERLLMSQLPESVRDKMVAMKQLVDGLGREAVALNLLSQDSYERNKMAYLHRSYAKHEESITGGLSPQRGAAIRAETFKGRGITEYVGDDQLIQNIDEVHQGDKLLRIEKLDANGRVHSRRYIRPTDPVPEGWRAEKVWEARYFNKPNRVGMWRDLTDEERLRLGELDEIRFAFAKTVLSATRDIENARFLAWVNAEHGRDPDDVPSDKIRPAGEGFLTSTSYEPDEWVVVPNSTIEKSPVKRYGALAGRAVPGVVWNDVRNQMAVPREGLTQFYETALRAWKISKTALSPAVHMNNVMANFVMADIAEVGVHDILRALKVLIQAKRGDAASTALWDRYADSGAELGSFAAYELNQEVIEPFLKELAAQEDTELARATLAQIISLAAHGKVGDALRGLAASKTAHVAKLPFKAMMTAYQAEDGVFRLAKWLKMIDGGMDDKAAGKEARKAFLDYNINAPWIQTLRRTALPFIAFSYRAIPLLAKTVRDKPWKIAKYYAVASAINAVAYAMLGGDGDEDRERRLLPPEMQGKMLGLWPRAIRLPWNDEAGSPLFWDVRRWFPAGDVFDLAQAHSAVSMPPWLMAAGPLALMAELMTNRSVFTGKQITQDTDTFAEALAKVTDHVFKFAAPNLPLPGPGYVVPGTDRGQLQTYSWTGIVNAGTGRTDPFGREQSLPTAVSSAFGVKIKAYPEDMALLSAKQRYDAAKKEIDAQLAKDMREFTRNGITRAELDKKMAKAQEKLEKAANELIETVR